MTVKYYREFSIEQLNCIGYITKEIVKKSIQRRSKCNNPSSFSIRFESDRCGFEFHLNDNLHLLFLVRRLFALQPISQTLHRYRESVKKKRKKIIRVVSVYSHILQLFLFPFAHACKTTRRSCAFIYTIRQCFSWRKHHELKKKN